MKHIWTFSPQSQPLLQQVLKQAGPPEESNKWIKLFGLKNLSLIKTVDKIDLSEDSPEMNTTPVPPTNQEEDISSVLEEFLDPDFDLLSKFDYFQEKGANNPQLLSKLAQNLPTNTIEKLNHHIFDNNNLEHIFLQNYYEHFLPLYIKRDNSRLCTDLLIKVNKLHSQYFNILLKVIFKDLEVQNTIINDFILTLNSDEQTEFLINISTIDLSNEQFSHNLFNILTAYKGSNKTKKIQQYIFSLIKTHSQFCTTDKNFGKLLLIYLQQEKQMKCEINSLIIIEGIIEEHKSPFRRPCLSLFKEINDS